MLHDTPLAARPTAPLFGGILRPDSNVLLVERRLDRELAQALRSVAEGAPFSDGDRVDAREPDVSALVQHVEDELVRAYLSFDIAMLVRELGAVLDRRHLHARLSVVSHDACRKLHADNVTIRLLCTYAGPGTEWVGDDDVVRGNLVRIDLDVETANRSVVRPGGAVRHCEVGDRDPVEGRRLPRLRRARRGPPLAPDRGGRSPATGPEDRRAPVRVLRLE